MTQVDIALEQVEALFSDNEMSIDRLPDESAKVLADEVLALREKVERPWISVKERLPPNGEKVEILGEARRNGGKHSSLWCLDNTCVRYWRALAQLSGEKAVEG